MKIALKRPEGSKGDFVLLPDGKYRVQVSQVEEVDDQYGGIRLSLKVLQGDYVGKEVNNLRVFPRSVALRSLVEVLGDDPDSDEVELNTDDLENLALNVYLTAVPSKKNPEMTFQQIKRFAPVPKK